MTRTVAAPLRLRRELLDNHQVGEREWTVEDVSHRRPGSGQSIGATWITLPVTRRLLALEDHEYEDPAFKKLSATSSSRIECC